MALQKQTVEYLERDLSKAQTSLKSSEDQIAELQAKLTAMTAEKDTLKA